MNRRLRVPRELVVFVLATGATIGAIATPSCGDNEQCIRCLPDPAYADAGVDAEPCPPCLPKDGVCPVGCIPEGYV